MRLGGWAFLSVAALAGPAMAQDLPRCPLLPPVEEVEVQHIPLPLRAAIGRDAGDLALPGSPFDAGADAKIGISRRLIWVRKQGTRWVIAYEQGGADYHDVVLSYEVGYDGSVAGVRKDVAYPATVCQITERELWR